MAVVKIYDQNKAEKGEITLAPEVFEVEVRPGTQPKSFVLRPGVIDVSIGRPIDSAGRRADELMREAEQWIEAEMQRLDPEAYPRDAAAPAARAAAAEPSRGSE